MAATVEDEGATGRELDNVGRGTVTLGHGDGGNWMERR